MTDETTQPTLRDRCVTAYRETGTLRGAAELVGCSKDTVAKYLHEAGVELPPPGFQGSRGLDTVVSAKVDADMNRRVQAEAERTGRRPSDVLRDALAEKFKGVR